MNDPFDLHRFVATQDSGDIYDQALREIRQGYKTSHWMWFVFPQIAGLGRSATARHYAVKSLAEAEAYLAHPVLGPRLRECARALVELGATDPVALFGLIDAQKLQSSMTLFNRAAPDATVFSEVLDRYFDGREDGGTLGHI